MSKFIKITQEKPFSLLVSLPKNDLALAKAAEEGGADGIKIHINVEHRASGTFFGSLKDERETIKSILSSVKIPVGIVPGASNIATEEEMIEITEMGLDFFDIYMENIPSYMLSLPERIGRMFATSYNFDLKLLPFLETWGINMLEASIMAPENYGRELRLTDLLLYEWLVKQSHAPVIIPTQLAIKAKEVKYLAKAGVKSIMIGAIVTGKEEDTIYRATKEFKKAIAEL